MLPPPPMESPEVPSSGGCGDRHRSFSYSPSILIIAAILAFATVAIASIHLLLRFLSRHSRSSAPFIGALSSSSSSSSATSAADSSDDRLQKEEDTKSVVDSLPLFSLSSAAGAKSPSSLDCAVCLSPFEPCDELRLLPSCRHAFHSQCIDTWLRSTLSCPLCRSSIASPQPPPPLPEEASIGSSESFRLEIGSVSRRTDSSADDQPPPPPAAASAHARTYSLGSSFEYLVEEEVEAVLARIRRPENSGDVAVEPPPRPPPSPPPLPPGSPVAEMAGGGGSRSWLREYVDRLASSASSSFSSLRRSRRFESAASGGGGDWDLEGNLHMHLEEEDGGFSSFYRWLVGA
ncbi:uncharacterized protein M6B38_404760 [Iris pallida]|uniref:RING-type E3 ubiquitin transferase n=1 Tax=Iris pallida TaxID=29817 RepID=A0AAX6FSH4_IRIPA|nr:uncharacterized protein M6B38_404760 [Iris pallida]